MNPVTPKIQARLEIAEQIQAKVQPWLDRKPGEAVEGLTMLEMTEQKIHAYLYQFLHQNADGRKKHQGYILKEIEEFSQWCEANCAADRADVRAKMTAHRKPETKP